MRGVGGITDALNSLMASAGVSVQPWFFPAIMMLIFTALIPHIRQNQRTQKAREQIRKWAENGGANSSAFQDEILDLAQGHATTLLVIGTEAHKRGVKTLAQRALHQLEQTGKHRNDARKLRAKLTGPPPLHPEAEIAAIEILIDQGLVEMARNRIEQARINWPENDAWTYWESKIASEE